MRQTVKIHACGHCGGRERMRDVVFGHACRPSLWRRLTAVLSVLL